MGAFALIFYWFIQKIKKEKDNMELMNKLWAAAKADKRRIVLPEGDEERTIIATEKIQKLGLAFPILVGNEEKIS